ncbi:MAG TPA: diaminopimelate decarboxylase [Beutenbergiaceae bacterium]|nr:diaminopimelate decarboxylase [Beutenbergiaceae bacterium]
MNHPPSAHLWPDNVRNDEGTWSMAGLTFAELAERFDTPSFLLDVAALRRRARRYREVFQSAFEAAGAQVQVYYASKAFSSTAVLRWVHAEGLRVDVASHGELLTAVRAGVPGPDIGLHGNNKSDAEIALALDHGIGRIIVDSLPEIDQVAELARIRGVRAPVLVRVTTGVHAGGHDFIATAHEDQKFGLSLASGAAAQALELIEANPHLELRGLHSHIGSQILDPEGFAAAAGALFTLRADLAADGGPVLPEVDLGGGLGIAYLPGDQEPNLEHIAARVADAVLAASEKDQLPLPELSFEPGRAVIGPAMCTLYRVGTVKPVALDDGGQRLYVSVDGGMSDNLRTALYGAAYHADLVSRHSTAEPLAARVVGMHCESGDVVVRDVRLPADITAGDLLAVPATGAYGRSMASNYNLVARPPVVAVADGGAREIVRRESIEDVLALDVG